MSVIYNETRRIFKLDTENTSYLIGISPEGYVGHVYYGEYLEDADAYYLLRTEEPPFTPSVNEREKSSFLDYFPTEYPSGEIPIKYDVFSVSSLKILLVSLYITDILCPPFCHSFLKLFQFPCRIFSYISFVITHCK